MSSVQSMRQFVCDRLTAAAQEILGAFEKKIEDYEAEIARQRRLLVAVSTPEIKLHRAGWKNHFSKACQFFENSQSIHIMCVATSSLTDQFDRCNR